MHLGLVRPMNQPLAYQLPLRWLNQNTRKSLLLCLFRFGGRDRWTPRAMLQLHKLSIDVYMLQTQSEIGLFYQKVGIG